MNHMARTSLVGCTIMLVATRCVAQNGPWENPLLTAWSDDGISFSAPTVFQDSAGVPSVIRWHGDTLICAFQWFRQPNPSPSWDRVAVKMSYDAGASWTEPAPIVVNGMPANQQRPFDPALTAYGGDSLRLYFSSSEGMPMGLDSTVNTYSAWSTDGIHYQFEPGPRVDVVDDRVIDPSVIRFGPGWHYCAPAGAPQDGAYHYLSPDGITFNAVPLIVSDMLHNWTGNYMVESSGELRFYGAGPNGIWYNSSPNGGQWNGYVNTNLHGGDPSALKIGDGSYLIIYVGAPGGAGIVESPVGNTLRLVPIPASSTLRFEWPGHAPTQAMVMGMDGRISLTALPVASNLAIDGLPPGAYVLELIDANGARVRARFVKE